MCQPPSAGTPTGSPVRKSRDSVLESVHITSKPRRRSPRFELKAQGAAVIKIGTDLRQHGFHGLILGREERLDGAPPG